MKKEIALVFMVAGISSRYKGKIKALVQVGEKGENLIEYSLKQALPYGFTKIMFIVSKQTKPHFEGFFKDNYQGVPVFYALQDYNPETRDKPWGTTDALCSAKDIIDCPCIVCNGDDIYGEETFKLLANHLQNNNEDATAGYKLGTVLPEQGATRRGLFETKEDYVTKITEIFDIVKSNLERSNLKPEDLVSMNIFALHPKTVLLLDNKLREFKDKHQGDRKIESLLPNNISELIEKGQIKMRIYPTSAKWLGITNPGDEEEVRKELSSEYKNL